MEYPYDQEIQVCSNKVRDVIKNGHTLRGHGLIWVYIVKNLYKSYPGCIDSWHGDP